MTKRMTPAGGRLLLVASTGGHLAQLHRLSTAWDVHEESLWVTFKSEQSTSLLAGKNVLFVPYIRSRDVIGVLRTILLVAGALRGRRFDAAVSTGAALALSVFPVAWLYRIPRTYIESVSRLDGPSMTGRLIQYFRLARLYTQHASWADRHWQVRESVLSRFAPAKKPAAGGGMPLRIFVTLGTIRPYRFDAMIDGLLRTGLVGESTVWQLGETRRADLPGRAIEQVSATEFLRLTDEADVVVTHSGVGTILGLLERGIHPVVVPRRSERGEHVDDHQLQIARLLAEQGVATVVEAPELNAAALQTASRLRTVPAA